MLPEETEPSPLPSTFRLLLSPFRFPPSWSTEWLAGFDAGQMAMLKFKLAVHKDIFNTFGEACRAQISCSVFDLCRIKNRDIRIKAGLQQTATSKMLTIRGQTGDFADGIPQAKQALSPPLGTQETRHRSPRAWVIVRLVKRPIQIGLLRVESDACPRLLEAVLQVWLAGQKIERFRLRVVRQDQIEQGVQRRLALTLSNLLDGLPLIFLQSRIHDG